ncbi:hypothetical protein [Actinophytocola sp.]|jgi:hypothetical protein|uniref:hypothetical protein n=1 Tax=Actinophytocola sp. TaxID=1872138 RepID=UPI002ED96D49
MARVAGLLLLGLGTVLTWLAAAGVVVGALLAFDPPWWAGASLAGAGVVVGGVGWLALRAGRRLGPPPVVARAALGAFGLRFAIVAIGLGLVLFGALTDQPLPDRLFLFAFGGFFLGMSVLVLAGDLRLRRDIRESGDIRGSGPPDAEQRGVSPP